MRPGRAADVNLNCGRISHAARVFSRACNRCTRGSVTDLRPGPDSRARFRILCCCARIRRFGDFSVRENRAEIASKRIAFRAFCRFSSGKRSRSSAAIFRPHAKIISFDWRARTYIHLCISCEFSAENRPKPVPLPLLYISTRNEWDLQKYTQNILSECSATVRNRNETQTTYFWDKTNGLLFVFRFAEVQ